MINNFSPNLEKHKFIVTIVKKSLASKIVKASKQAGVGGGTIVYGKGTGIHEHASFWGIQIEPEKEIILTLASEGNLNRVLATIVEAGKLYKPGSGVGFVIDTKKVAGIAHLLGMHEIFDEVPVQEADPNFQAEKEIVMDTNMRYDLIVTIVNKGNSDKVVDATKTAGAEGGTILYGRGTGVREKAKLFSIQIEPEKELVLTLITRDKTEQVLAAILDGAELSKPGKGVAFVLEVEKTVGINHLVNQMINEQVDGI